MMVPRTPQLHHHLRGYIHTQSIIWKYSIRRLLVKRKIRVVLTKQLRGDKNINKTTRKKERRVSNKGVLEAFGIITTCSFY